MSIVRLAHTTVAAAALAAGLALGLAVEATAQPVGNSSDDFWECAADHQDTDGIGVCCVFYGGDYDEGSGECYLDEAAPASKSPTTGSAKKPVLTNVSRTPVARLS
jgi:F0F1-type ATP synthase membrane subunit c/vacuolar-type H+-ATPase subunit K